MSGKKVLVIGSGGREHAIACAFAKSKQVEKVYALPGNAGTRLVAENVALPVSPPFSEILAFAKEQGIDLTFVGPEQPLVDGIVDAFEKTGLRACGPSQAAAQLEGSKIFTKRLLTKHGIPTAPFDEFSDYDSARAYIASQTPPYVLKADGLAAGKGVIIAQSNAEAEKALAQYFKEKRFGDAGDNIIIEGFLEGEEASILAFTDGKDALLLPPSQDHKRAYDNDEGPNTGGMGAYSPIKLLNDAQIAEIKETIILATIRALKKEGIPYKGVIYAGLMMKNGKASVVEFNCRLGDPECQAVLPLMETDIYDVANAVCEGRIGEMKMKIRDAHALTLVAASGGYPEAYEKGIEIEGELSRYDNEIHVYHAGVSYENGGYRSAGGRVLAVTAFGDSLQSSIDAAYRFMDEKIHFDGMHYRRDIGAKGL